jgi:hypothetical protein
MEDTMKRRTIALTAAAALAVILIVKHNQDSMASVIDSGSVSQAAQSRLISPWFHSAPHMQLVNENPEVIDVRESPEHQQMVEITMSDPTPDSTYNGTNDSRCPYQINRQLQSPTKRIIASTPEAIDSAHDPICKHLLNELVAKDQTSKRCAVFPAGGSLL